MWVQLSNFPSRNNNPGNEATWMPWSRTCSLSCRGNRMTVRVLAFSPNTQGPQRVGTPGRRIELTVSIFQSLGKNIQIGKIKKKTPVHVSFDKLSHQFPGNAWSKFGYIGLSNQAAKHTAWKRESPLKNTSCPHQLKWWGWSTEWDPLDWA